MLPLFLPAPLSTQISSWSIQFPDPTQELMNGAQWDDLQGNAKNRHREDNTMDRHGDRHPPPGLRVVHVFVVTCNDRKSRKGVQGVLLNFLLFPTLPLAPEAFWKCLTNLAVRCWRLLLLLCVLEFSVQVLEHVLVTFPCVHDFLEQTQRASGQQTPFIRNTSSPQLYH